MSNPLAQNNWGNKWGCCTGRQDKSNAKPLARTKEATRMINNLTELELQVGSLHLKTLQVGSLHPKTAAEAKPPYQHDFKNEFARLPCKTKYKMHCFQVPPWSNLLLQHHCNDTEQEESYS